MIAFAAPWALLGLVAAALPVLLHLVQRREPPEVAFPAVRYLEDATRDHRRRLRLRHLLLLAVRTLLIVAIVLAAARPTLARSGLGDHAPSALALVVDNSASSATMVDGVAALDRIISAARRTLDRATPVDRLWLITADGVARPGSSASLRDRLVTLRTEPVHMALGEAIAQGRDLVRGTGRPGEVVVISDLQRSAITAARGSGPLLVLRPDGAASVNRAIAALSPGAQPWGPDGGRVGLAVASSDTTPVAVTIGVSGRALREVLVTPGAPASQRIPAVAPGWTTVTASMPPDEFRLDDSRMVALHAAPPAGVRWDAADQWIAAALDVLAADGRVRPGEGLRFGTLGPGPSFVFPPDDASRIGAMNRLLASRGSAWRFGAMVVSAERTDSNALLPVREAVSRRVRLEPTATSGGEVLATVAGEPWLVRSGDLLLIGSRFDPSWTALPLAAAFVPLLDAIVTRVARGAPELPEIAAGSAVRIPERATAVVQDGIRHTVEGGALWYPPTLGVHYLLAGPDTLGAISVHLDLRESDFARADDRDVRALWPGARLADMTDGPQLAFTLGGRGDVRGALLLLALACVLAETALAGRVPRRS